MNEQELWSAYHADRSDTNRNALVMLYMPQTEVLANRFAAKLPNSIDPGDMQSVAMLGLMRAIETFDPKRKVKFTSYYQLRIYGAMVDELRQMDWVPRLVRANYTNAQQELAEHWIESGDIVDNSPVIPHQMSLFSKRANVELGVGKIFAEADIIPDCKSPDPTCNLQKQSLLALVTTGFSKRERLILILYYYEDLTFKQIAETIGVTESRVSQLHSALVVRLKDRLAGREEEFTT